MNKKLLLGLIIGLVVGLIIGFLFPEIKINRVETVTSCNLKQEQGSCKAYFIKYYFDNNERKCMEFVWGGCGGVVPFDTLEECQFVCE